MLLVPGASKFSDVTGRQNPNTPARNKEIHERPVRIPGGLDKLRSRTSFKDKRSCNSQQFSKADLLLVLKCPSSSEVQKKRGWFYRKSFTTSRKAMEVFRTCPPLSTATNTRWSKIDYDSWPD